MYYIYIYMYIPAIYPLAFGQDNSVWRLHKCAVIFSKPIEQLVILEHMIITYCK